MKDVGLRIRIQKELRDRFIDACHSQDIPAAQVLREFIRDFVSHTDAANDRPAKRGARKENRR